MLGKIVRVSVTKPFNFFDRERNIRYQLNYGLAVYKTSDGEIKTIPAFILGITHPVNTFEGRVVCVVEHENRKNDYIVIAPKKIKPINYEIEDSLSFYKDRNIIKYDCLFEKSCGAAIYKRTDGNAKFLLIKNLRSKIWGFPKGHMERGENMIQTAKREVLEETGLHIKIYRGFVAESNYNVGKHVKKSVSIFLAKASDNEQITIQSDEIQDYIWLPYEEAYYALNFDNDKRILSEAYNFLNKNINIEAEL
jgi:8-oxo-dGTP pyrophosphatase MutT (NUDIX family)